MRLELNNDFTWDGIYGILDDSGVERFSVEASITDDGRKIVIYNTDHKEVGSVRQKRISLGREYNMYAYDGTKIGTAEMPRKYPKQDYTFKLKDMMLSGEISKWNFIIVDPKKVMAESGISYNHPALEITDEEDDIICAVLLIGAAGLASDIKEGADSIEDPVHRTMSLGKNFIKAVNERVDDFLGDNNEETLRNKAEAMTPEPEDEPEDAAPDENEPEEMPELPDAADEAEEEGEETE